MAFIRTKDHTFDVTESVSNLRSDFEARGVAVATLADGATVLLSLAGLGWVELQGDGPAPVLDGPAY